MKTILGLFSFLFAVSSAFAQESICPQLDLPEQFSLNQRIFTWGNSFNIVDAKKQKSGTVVQKLFNFKTTYAVRNNQNEVVATAAARILSGTLNVDLYDCHHKKIGNFTKGFWSDKFSGGAYATYTISDHDNNVIGKSTQATFLTTKLEIYSQSEGQTTLAAVLHRGFFGRILKDKWTVTLQPDLDPRMELMVLMMAAFKTQSDEKEEAKPKPEPKPDPKEETK